MAMGSIRFGVQAAMVADPVAWHRLARRAEDLGFDTLYVADHVGVTPSPFVALSAAATVTSTLKLGTYVLNAGVRDPLTLASDAATLDVLSDGRLILGVGAGHTPAEWTMSGRAYPTATARVQRLAETVRVVPALLNGEIFSYQGRHITLAEAYLLAPRPVSTPVPLLIGGNGTQVLRLGAQYADVVSLAGLGQTLEDGHRHTVEWSAASIDERVAVVREAAQSRTSPLRLDALVQYVEITEHRSDVAERLAGRIGTTPADLLGCPYALIGTVNQLIDELRDHRERWGFTSYVVRADALEQVVALIARLQ